MRTSLAWMVCGSLALAACGDDTTGTGGGGGSGGGGTTSGTTSSTSGTPGATSSSSSSTSSGASTSSASSTSSTASGDQGGGGNGQGGDGGNGNGGNGGNGQGGNGQGGNGQGGNGQGGNGGGGEGGGGEGGGAVCPEVPIGDTIEEECAYDGPHALPREDVAECTELDPSWPVQVFELSVEEGDCVHLRVDNAGSDGAGTFGFIVDPAGDNIWVLEEAECAVENLDGYLCAEGAITMGSTGDAFILAGVYAGEGCELGSESPIQVMVSINGVDVELAPAVCRGDIYAF